MKTFEIYNYIKNARKLKATLLLVLISIATFVYSLLREPHQFTQQECTICHIGPNYGESDVKTKITFACETCHSENARILSHPTDVYPTISIPKDMPLTEGRLTCLTCHYTHNDKDKQFTQRHYFLRRQIRGIIFCSACHKLDHNKHIIFRNAHKGVYDEMNINTRIDPMSLECIQCHDRKLSDPKLLGAGSWMHLGKKFNHPIGIKYRDVSSRKMNGFNPPESIRREVKLFNGKIGCGTCHNIYSKEKGMLSMSNRDGKLCTQCHRK